MKLGILTSHPIQYQAPLFRELASRLELRVFFAHRQSAQQQASAGYGVAFEWDRDLLTGYPHEFLVNRAKRPGVDHFWGCDTPGIADRIRRGDFDVFLVSGWHLMSFWQAILACRRNGTPIMVRGDSHLITPRHALKRWLKLAIYPILLQQFDAALYVGQPNREYLLHYGVPPERLFFAPHCVDEEYFVSASALSDRSVTRAEWGVSEAARAVLFVGRLISSKRPADLIHALRHLREAGIDVVGVFAGDGDDRVALQNLSRQLGVPAVFLGFCNQSALPAIYRAADVLALPSGAETWGLVVNEAMASGTPCVVSDACGCVPDMIVPTATGEVFEMGDVSDLARALIACLRIPRDSRPLLEKTEAYSVSATAAGVVEACRYLAGRGAWSA